jgi:hypothetical protein
VFTPSSRPDIVTPSPPESRCQNCGCGCRTRRPRSSASGEQRGAGGEARGAEELPPIQIESGVIVTPSWTIRNSDIITSMK